MDLCHHCETLLCSLLMLTDSAVYKDKFYMFIALWDFCFQAKVALYFYFCVGSVIVHSLVISIHVIALLFFLTLMLLKFIV